MHIVPGTVGVVTGAASGIGNAIARAFASRRMRLVVADVDTERLDLEVQALRAGGATVAAASTDVSSPEAVEALAELAWSTYGGIDTLCNNAGVLDAALTWERELSQWRRVLGTNLGGVINGIRSFVPRMIEAGRPGHVVNIASIAAYLPRPGIAPYNASKAGVVAISETLAMDLASVGSQLGVSVVLPGGVESRLSRDIKKADENGSVAAGSGLRAASDVAESIITAVETNKFYVFTHPERYAGVDARLNAVLGALRGESTDLSALTAVQDDTQSSIGTHVQSAHTHLSGAGR